MVIFFMCPCVRCCRNIFRSGPGTELQWLGLSFCIFACPHAVPPKLCYSFWALPLILELLWRSTTACSIQKCRALCRRVYNWCFLNSIPKGGCITDVMNFALSDHSQEGALVTACSASLNTPVGAKIRNAIKLLTLYIPVFYQPISLFTTWS